MRVLALLAAATVILAQSAPPLEKPRAETFDRTEEVAPGVTFRERRFWRGNEGPFTMQILEIQPKHPAVNLLAVRGNDRLNSRETVSSMARRYGAAAAVNGGYFVVSGPLAGASTGPWQFNRRPMYAGSGRSGVVFCEEQDFVEQIEVARIDWQGEVRAASGQFYPLAGLNREAAGDELVVFEPDFGENTPAAEEGTEVALDSGGKVIAIEEEGGGIPIPEGGLVLSGKGAAAEWLARNATEGAELEVAYALQTTPASCVAEDIVGAGPRIVREGEVSVAEEGFGHASVRHPRTAAAVTRRGTILLVTVDGRQANSIGMRLDELAEELVALGAREAVNLDGGGSTTMVVQGRIRNSPSDPRERPVSDGILVFSIASAEDLQGLLERLVNNTGHIQPQHWPALREALSQGPAALRQAVDALEGRGVSPAAARLLREGAYAVEAQAR